MDLKSTRVALQKLHQWASEGKLDANKIERLNTVLKTRLASSRYSQSVTNGVKT